MVRRVVKCLGVIPVKTKKDIKYSLRKINGLPLLHWSIKYARESERLKRVVVLSEDRRVRRLARSYDVPVVKSVDEICKPEIIVILHPTSPIRYKRVIDECMRVYKQEECDTLITGFETQNTFFSTGCVEIRKTKQEGEENIIKYKVPEEFNLQIKSDLDFVSVGAVMKHLGLML